MILVVFHAATQLETGCRDSLVMSHADRQNRFGERELQHQLVFGVT